MAADDGVIDLGPIRTWGGIWRVNPALPWAQKIDLGLFCLRMARQDLGDAYPHAIIVEKPRMEWVPSPIIRYEVDHLNWPAWRIIIRTAGLTAGLIAPPLTPITERHHS